MEELKEIVNEYNNSVLDILCVFNKDIIESMNDAHKVNEVISAYDTQWIRMHSIIKGFNLSQNEIGNSQIASLNVLKQINKWSMVFELFTLSD